jgi:hypothetical protein
VYAMKPTLIFILPIVSSIAARRIFLVSGFALLASVIVVLVGFYASVGMLDVLRVLARVYPWFHVFFGIMFIAIAKQVNNRVADGEQK